MTVDLLALLKGGPHRGGVELTSPMRHRGSITKDDDVGDMARPTHSGNVGIPEHAVELHEQLPPEVDVVTNEEAKAAIYSWLWDELHAASAEEIAGAMRLKLDVDHPEDLQRIREARAGLLIEFANKARGFL